MLNIYVSYFPCNRCNQNSCLATGLETSFSGGVEVRDSTVIVGWVNDPVVVKIMLNEKVIETIEMAQLLEQPDGRYGFQRELTGDEKSPGLKMVKAYALVSDMCKSKLDFFSVNCVHTIQNLGLCR